MYATMLGSPSDLPDTHMRLILTGMAEAEPQDTMYYLGNQDIQILICKCLRKRLKDDMSDQ